VGVGELIDLHEAFGKFPAVTWLT